jgi:hypothetical protein
MSAKAVRVKSLPPSKKSDAHPYEEWFDGGSYKLTQGKHFTAKMASMRVQLYRAAGARGVKLTLREYPDGKSFGIQADKNKAKTSVSVKMS